MKDPYLKGNSVPPDPNTSDKYIVTKYEYDANTGRLAWTKDNKDRQTRRLYDALGRATSVIENYSDGNPANETADKDRTTQYTYDPNSRLAKITACNSTTGDQVTYYFYSNTDNDAGNNSLPSHSWVTAVVYPREIWGHHTD